MTSDHYFCTCVGHDPRTRDAVLSVLRALAGSASHPRTLAIAIDELGRCDVWTRVYAMPALLRALGLPEMPEAGRIRGWLLLASTASNAMAEKAMAALLDAIQQGAGASRIAAEIELCARQIARSDAAPSGETPYMDLPVQATAVAWLAAVRQELANPGRAAISALLMRESQARFVVDDALRGRYGRLPFLLSVDALERAGAPLAPAELEQYCAMVGNADVEPDLIALARRREFGQVAQGDMRVREALLNPRPWTLHSSLESMRTVQVRLGIEPPSERRALVEKTRALGDALRLVTRTVAALEVEPNAVYALLHSGVAIAADGPFWMALNKRRPRQDRYAIDPDVAAWSATTLAFAWGDLLERGVEVPPVVWCHLAHLCDILFCMKGSRQPSAALQIAVRIAAARMNPEVVVAYLDGITGGSSQLRMLKARIATQFIRWFMMAYRQGVEGRPELQWLRSASCLGGFARRSLLAAVDSRVATGDEVVDAACVAILFGQEDIAAWLPLLPTPKAGEWPHSAREFLLPVDRSESELYKALPLPPDSGPHRLALAFARCVAWTAGSAHDPLAEWTAAWAGAQGQRLFIDPLLRVRLIEQLRSKALLGSHALEAVEDLLASDSPYEVHATLERVFGAGAPRDLLAEHAHQLLVSRVEGERLRAEHRDTPLPVAVELDRADTLRICCDWLARLMADDVPHDWVVVFDERRAMTRVLRSPLHRTVDYLIEHDQGRPVLRRAAGTPEAVMHVSAAVVDEERQRATVVAAVLDADTGLARGVLDAAPVRKQDSACIGIVDRIDIEGGEWKASIRIGAYHDVMVSCDADPGWIPGSYLAVPISWPGSGPRPVAARDKPPRLLPLHVESGDVEEVAFDPGTGPGNFSLMFARPTPWDPLGAGRGEFDRKAWRPQPDTTPLRPPRRWAQYDGLRWQPLVEDRLALLSAMAWSQVAAAVLAWTDVAQTSALGERTWILDAGAGLRYAIGLSDFTDESRKRFLHLVGSGYDASDGTPGHLVKDTLVELRAGPDGRLEWVGTHDDRLRWNQLFRADEDTVHVRFDATGYYAMLSDVQEHFAGRPERLGVRWEGAPGPNARDGAEAVVHQWDPVAAVLRVRIPTSALRIPEDQWIEACRRWLSVEKGDAWDVDAVWNGPSMGDRMLGQTVEGFSVQIPAEEWWGWRSALAVGERQTRRSCRVSVEQDSRALEGLTELPAESVETGVDLSDPMWNGCRGVLCRLTRQVHGVWTAVIWPGQSRQPQVVHLKVDLPAQARRVHVGDLLSLRSTGGSCRITLKHRPVVVRPVWTVENEREPVSSNGPWFRILVHGRVQAAKFLFPDRLRLADATVAVPPVLQCEGVVRWFRKESGRLVAELPGGDVVAGNLPTMQYVPRQRCHWSVVDALVPIEGANRGFHLKRDFVGLVAFHERLDDLNGLSAADQAELKLQQDLQNLLQSGDLVAVTVRDDHLHLRDIVLPASERTKGPRGVALADGTACWVEAAAGQWGQVMLVRGADGRLQGSPRRVPPLESVGAWCDYLTQSRVVPGFFAGQEDADTVIEFPHLPLFYVGPEVSDPWDDTPYEDGLRYRFEWAPGRCLLLRPEALRFASAEFALAADQLFFGDAVHRVKLTRDHHCGWILDILEVGVRSVSRLLFEQARRWNVVHLLEVVRDESTNSIKVKSVEGVDEASLEMRPRTHRTRAVFTQGGAARLAQVMGELREGVVHGRVSQKRYLDSHGRELEFEPVWLSIGPNGLSVHERVFLAAGEIQTSANDCHLEFHPPAGLLGPVDSLVAMSRRGFSARADLLRRIYADDPSALREAKYLVRLQRRGESAPRVVLIDPSERAGGGVPLREQRQLEGWLDAPTREPPLVTVLDPAFEGSTLLEIRPGVFASVRADQMDCDGTLRFGTVLRLTRRSGRLSAVVAVPSDHDLVPPDGRGITLLPMAPREKVNEISFTAEGMPGAVSSLPHGDVKVAARMASLLRDSHPRPAWLAPRGGHLHIWPDLREEDAAVMMAAAMPLGATLDVWGGARHVVPWTALTFADQDGARLVHNATNRRWRPHDRMTWSFGAGGAIVRAPVPVASGVAITLFAQRHGAELRMRYARETLARFTFGPRELVEMLPADVSQAWRVAVAAVDAEKRWLFIEATPGRIHAVPLALLVVRQGAGTGETPLDGLALDCIGQGDELELYRAVGSPVEVDRICLVRWIPGARGALGGLKVALVLHHSDADRGASEYGLAPFVLTLPMTGITGQMGRCAVIHQDNRVVPAPTGIAGAGALLRIDQGELRIDGLSGYACWPATDYDWEADTFGRELFRRRDELPPAPGALLRAFGKPVPVTIDFLNQSERVVRFSRRGLFLPQAEGIVGLQVMGRFDDRAIVRLGSQLRTVPLRNLVYGVPESFDAMHQLAVGLASVSDMLWARIAPEGVQGGFAPPRDAGDSGAYVPLCIVARSENAIGIICRCLRSHALHWLAPTEAGWADFAGASAALQAVLLSVPRRLRAVVRPDGSLSVTGHRLASMEFGSTRPGMQLVVEHTGVSLPNGTSLVRSAASGVLLAFTESGEPDTEVRAMMRRRDTRLRHLQAEPFVANRVLLDVSPAGRVDVAQEIEVILRLHDEDPMKPQARLRFHELARRAWRHWSTELVQQKAPGLSTPRWALFEKLRPVLLGHVVAVPEVADSLRGFCRVVELTEWGGDQQLQHLGAACRALMGDLNFFSIPAVASAVISQRLVSLARIAPPQTFTGPLPASVVQGLRQIAEDLAAEPFRLEFGPPLPQVG